MATTTKLVSDLAVTLRGVRSHEGVIAARIAQARTPDVAARLRDTADRERALADRAAAALTRLGAPAPRLRPSWVPSPTSLVAAAASAAQPLGDALVAEATALHMVADRARVVRSIAEATGERVVVGVATALADLYDGYTAWLVETAAVLVVDEDAADLVPTAQQRLAGRAKDLTGVPARVYAGVWNAVTRTGTDSGALPVPDYDERTAAEAVEALRGLDDADDVSALLAYEARHQDRKTVLDAGDKRIAELVGARD